MDEHSLRTTLINPFYAITLHSDLVGDHEHLVSKDQWVAANARLIEEIGVEAWLAQLLATLEGGFPRNEK
jgi:hypothetical protein